MAEFGDWQRFLDSCVKRLVNDGSQFEAFKKASTDEDRILFVKRSGILKQQWIEKFIEAANNGVPMKSKLAACQYRKDGNKYFEKKQFDTAVQYYNKCVINAPVEREGSELSLGFANRSAALFHLHDYKGCLSDIQLALDYGYPDDLAHKLMMRRGQCLMHLGQLEGAKSELLLAKETLSKQTLADTKKSVTLLKEIDDLLKKLDEKLSVGATANTRNHTNEEVQRNLTIPVGGYGTTVVQASATIDLKCDSRKGRHLVANQKIRAGDVLIVEKPYSAILLPSHFMTNCLHCLAKVTTVIPCRNCASVVYCCRECETDSWVSYHSIECPLLDLLQSVGIAHLSLRIVLTARLKALTEFRETVIAQSCQKTDEGILGLTSEGSYSCNYLSVYHLMPHTNDMLAEDLYQYALTASLLLSCLESSDFFHPLDTKTQMSDCQNPSSVVLYIGGLLLRHICQLVCNAHAITDLQLTQFSDSSLVASQNQVRVATAIYPTASLMNHSCDPTIISSFMNDTLIVRAVKDVEAGEEIFNCYGPHCKRMARSVRQQHLQEQYFFDCDCSACQVNENEELCFKALKCRKCEGPACGSSADGYLCMSCGQSLKHEDVAWTDLCKASNMFECGLRHLDQHMINDAISNFRACFKIRKRLLYRRNKELAEVQDALAQCYSIKGEFVSAQKHLSESIQTSEQLYGSTSIEFANELQKYSDVCLHARKIEDAISAARQATDIFTLNYGPDSDQVLELRNFVNLCLESKPSV